MEASGTKEVNGVSPSPFSDENGYDDEDIDGADDENKPLYTAAASDEDGTGRGTHLNEHASLIPARRHLINMIIMSVCFFFVFTAYMALQSLQASLNSSGKTCLAVIYGMLVVSCFVTPALVQRLSPRITMVMCMLMHCLFTAANYYPVDYLLLVACGLLGFVSAPLWTAQQTYLTTSAHMYHSAKQQQSGHHGDDGAADTVEKVISRFNGIFFLIFQVAQVCGNLISSLVLQTSGAEDLHIGNESVCMGAANSSSNTTQDAIQDSVRYTLLSVYLACDVIGVLLCLFCLKSLTLSMSEHKATDWRTMCLATLRRMVDPYMLLLIPVVIYSGMEQAYIYGEFTKHYITDCVGIGWVGYAMLLLGLVDAACSVLCSRLANRLGRVPIVLTGALVNGGLLAFLIIWEKRPMLLVVFLFSALWGFVDAIWNTQLNTLFGVMFSKDQEAAFANFRLWQSIGFCISFAYGDVLDMQTKLWIMVAVLVLSTLFYLLAEVKRHREQASKNKAI